jgi:transcriptional regulator with XRE-family HTH domain
MICFAVGGLTDMQPLSQIVSSVAIPEFHSLCGDAIGRPWHSVSMSKTDKNGGPNHLRAWRLFRNLTLEELADEVGTSSNMIGYLETGERGLSAKWLRRLAKPLKTTPGHLLEHDPATLPNDIVEIWMSANEEQRAQLSDIAQALVKRGSGGS